MVSICTGQQYGRWVVLEKSNRRTKDGKRQPYWWCECQCEAKTRREVFAGDLRRGDKDGRSGSLSCGCLMRELASIRKTKHGMCDHPAYESWKQARNRCRNPEYDGYHLYGGRGITFSPEWDDFTAFWRDTGATWSEGLSIERIDVNDNYAPGNCTWATPKEQADNRRDTVWINTPDGRMTLKQAADCYGFQYNTLQARRRYGWPEADLLLPVRPLHQRQ